MEDENAVNHSGECGLRKWLPTVNVQKYSGMVWVYIYDADGNVSGINVSNINGNGTIDTDVSSLPNGEYSIDIVLSDNTYTRNFAI